MSIQPPVGELMMPVFMTENEFKKEQGENCEDQDSANAIANANANAIAISDAQRPGQSSESESESSFIGQVHFHIQGIFPGFNCSQCT